MILQDQILAIKKIIDEEHGGMIWDPARDEGRVPAWEALIALADQMQAAYELSCRKRELKARRARREARSAGATYFVMEEDE